MAIRTDAARRAQAGISLIEALVIVVVTAMIALLLLPLASQSAHRNFTLSARAIDAADASNAEGEFRAIMLGAEQVGAPGGGARVLEGAEDAVSVFPTLAAGAACAQAGAHVWLRLRIVRRDNTGGALVCEAREGGRDMLAWRRGTGAFSFSSDGATWSRGWRDARGAQAPRDGAIAPSRRAPLVKFTLAQPDEPDIVWIERVGWTEAARGEAQAPVSGQ